jgi:flavin reductase (DIM6/NTAB) family NADH-FMN oxidoreductase RutF
MGRLCGQGLHVGPPSGYAGRSRDSLFEERGVNPEAASEVFRRLDREVWLVTAGAGDRRGGLIATFVSQASLAPSLPRVLVGLGKPHFTWELVEQSDAFALHLLGDEHLDWVWRFGLQSGRSVDKLAGLETRSGVSGAPILLDARGWLDCRVEARLDTGDRTVYLAEVLDARPPDARPLLTVTRLALQTPPELRRELDAQRSHDAAIDARAIETWRRERTDAPGRA